ncbi:MAG: VWA domain-containing protein [Phycisphaerae bacterium]|nr:VWA domain-containing protein [Phycisphaerae bacterium]
MSRRTIAWACMVAGMVLSGFAGQTQAQTARPPVWRADNILVPQTRHAVVSATQPTPSIRVTTVDARIEIIDQVAATTLTLSLKNDSPRREEAELLVPIPADATVRGLAFQGPAPEATVEILPRDEARRIYESLVAQIRDPALLELAGHNLIRSSVFPVEPHGDQKIRLTYEQVLQAEDNRVDYLLPRSEALDYQVPWTIALTIRSKRPLSTAYSPSHDIEIKSQSTNHIEAKLSAERLQPGPFRLSYLLADGEISASMLCYPDPKIGGGYFLLLAGLPASVQHQADNHAIKREITLVIDRSGSMNGCKIEQVKEAALQIISGLAEGERFNLLTYQNTVDAFAKQAIPKTSENEAAARRYIDGITAIGGTNIHDALIEALRPEPAEGMLPIVLFLTDGLPTVGTTSERAIRELATAGNSHRRRVFTFGVGVDVNAPLLEAIADRTRARSSFVLPNQDVEVQVGRVFRQLWGPLLADTTLDIVKPDGGEALGRTRDLLPAQPPDLFAGDQLILLGKYIGDEPVTFLLGGNVAGESKSFKFTFDFDHATTRNGFVPRLWASRKIAELIDAVRQLGADNPTASDDPKVKELVDQIVALSTEFGILTEYTAFLAREGTDLYSAPAVTAEALDNLQLRAVRQRSGMGAVNQELNLARQKSQKTLRYDNAFIDRQLNRVAVADVQQVNDVALYRRGKNWVDSRVAAKAQQPQPQRTIRFASDEFFDLAQQLADENRQGAIALHGDILLEIDGQTVLVQGP